MKILTLLLLIVVLSTNCTRPETIVQNETIISIRKGDDMDLIKLSSLFNQVEIIPLETNQSCLLRGTYQVAIYDDRVFVMDYRSSTGVKVFSSSGEYIRAIGMKGKGPQEYVRLSNFSVLPSENRIYLADPNGEKILVFDLDGSYLSHIPLHMFSNEVAFYNSEHYYEFRHDSHYLHLYNIESADTLHFISHTNRFAGTFRSFYPGVNGIMLFSPPYHDSIYTLGKDSITLKYAFDFGPYYLSGEEYGAAIRKIGELRTPPNRIISIGNYGDFENYFVFDLMMEDNAKEYQQQTMIYNKETEIISIIDESSDDILFSEIESPYFVSQDNKWVCSVSPLILKENLDQIIQNKDFNYQDNIIEVINNLKEDDNPVLVIFSF